MSTLQMVDLKGQYLRLKAEIDAAIQGVMDSCQFIGGPFVDAFARDLANYQEKGAVIPCANGTDALQIALMALDLQPGDEVIVPSFTFLATAEVVALLKLKPVMVDVDPDHFNITADIIEPFISARTKVVIPVHLFGQNAPMSELLSLAKQHELYVIEDAAQSIGAEYCDDFYSGKSGTLGHTGCTSFFPSKNLGCYGDGGAVFCSDPALTQKMKMIANHGQSRRYYHEIVGINSRLDALQAAILSVKLKYLNEFSRARQEAAAVYDQAFESISALQIPHRVKYSSHVFHQYTLRVKDGRRDALQSYLEKKDIPHAIYYPVPLYKQNAFKPYCAGIESLPNTDRLCQEVISLPMHTEFSAPDQQLIIEAVQAFFK